MSILLHYLQKFRTILISDKNSVRKVLFIVTSVWFFFICSCWWLRSLIKKLIVLLNILFETKKKPLAVVNFKRSSEDYLKPSRCNWRRLFILPNSTGTLLKSDISLTEFVFFPSVQVKLSVSQILLQSNSCFAGVNLL